MCRPLDWKHFILKRKKLGTFILFEIRSTIIQATPKLRTYEYGGVKSSKYS